MKRRIQTLVIAVLAITLSALTGRVVAPTHSSGLAAPSPFPGLNPATGIVNPSQLPASFGVVDAKGNPVRCADGTPLRISRQEMMSPPAVGSPDWNMSRATQSSAASTHDNPGRATPATSPSVAAAAERTLAPKRIRCGAGNRAELVPATAP
jgi:hypothetical protein